MKHQIFFLSHFLLKKKNIMFVVVDERLYDLKGFADIHPGGKRVLEETSGSSAAKARDITDMFYSLHHPRAVKTLRSLRSTSVASQPPSELALAMRGVREVLTQGGYFEPQLRYYQNLAAWLVVLFACAATSTVCQHWCLGSLLMALFWQQAAGLGHDLGHGSVFERRSDNALAGSMLSFVTGLSASWWLDDHTTHHVSCNSIEGDPNIQHLPFFAITERFLDSVYSRYHRKMLRAGALDRALVCKQHLCFYPLMMTARLQLYVLGVLFMLRDPRRCALQLVGVAAFFSWMSVMLATLPWPAALGWFVVSHAAAGILHVQIVVSHWAMETDTVADACEWHERTLRTTMNIATPGCLDWVHVGLQFQIEHHFFPRLPRPNLRLARTLVRDALARLPDAPTYTEVSFLEANRMVLRRLAGVASGTSNHRESRARSRRGPHPPRSRENHFRI